jgi:hypothetical protein
LITLPTLNVMVSSRLFTIGDSSKVLLAFVSCKSPLTEREAI